MPGNNQDVALAIILVFPILSTLTVGLRCWSRLLGRHFGWDDGLIVVALVESILRSPAPALWWIKYLLDLVIGSDTKLTYQGYQSSDVPPLSTTEKVTGQKYNLANQLLYNPILAILKSSVIVFLFRLQDRWHIVRWNLYALSVVNMCLLIFIFLSDLFQCSPLRYVFDYPAMDSAAQKAAGADANGIKDGKMAKGGHCINQIAFFLGSAAFTIVTDIWLLCILAIIVWRLQMPKQRKMAIVGVLSMGVIVTALSIARLAIYAQRFNPNEDRTYNIGHTVSGAEANLASIAASAATL
ncbi:hypothetical protein BDV33DRAFT_208936 [Aspergillus novoparasiticus]|uniref:Rhodopsin domain-containing protein n=1 Tax=Aspergillus novoparasiticus TaxID=986946 RepID=A0A5N6EBU9_9EURO|nr:hypothetical protein BDV33DRAFT_208936 [Aspergillus novoparasiticus]